MASTSTSTTANVKHVRSHNVLTFGEESELDDISLPTAFDILKYYFFLSADCRNKNEKFSYKTLTPKVADKLQEIWKKIGIDVILRKEISKKLTALLNKYQYENKNRYNGNFGAFVQSTKKIFYIGKCKCPLEIDKCTCGQIPDRLREFVFDQHNQRKLSMLEYFPSPEDELTTHYPETLGTFGDATFNPNLSDIHSLETNVRTSREFYSPRYNTQKFAMMCDRFGVSDRLASCLASALFDDIGFKDDHGGTIIMDKRKVRRERDKARQGVLQKRNDEKSLFAFSFDGRKNDSLTRKKIDGVYHKNLSRESHLVVAREPHSELLGYINLEGKGETAEAKEKELIIFFRYKKHALDELIGVCCDGEATNTGVDKGILRRMELELDRPIHWFVCLLHFNELPFRHLYNSLEKSVTTGPTTESGVLSQKLDICHTLQVVENFELIPLENMPPAIQQDQENELSSDVKYLYKIANAVASGSCSNELANIKPGPQAHSRWITKASRVLRVYIATTRPSANLKVLARYVMKVYVPMYFNVKYYGSVIFGSVLLAKFITWTQFLPQKLREVVNTVIQNNCYFAHSENVLLSMLFDDRKEIRNLAVRKILYFRENIYDSTELRKYIKPQINFDCSDYVHMINLDDDELLSEPPFTRKIPYDYLKQYLNDNEQAPPLPDPQIPCHIQGTERLVQLLTGVAKRSIHENREGIMAVVSEGRKKLRRMETKQDLKGNI